jgi:DnaJ family protein B protein 4
MPGGTRSFHFSTGGGGNGFNFSNADDIFGEFMRNSGGGGGDDFDFGGFGMGGMPGGMGGMPGGGGGGKGGRFRGGRRAPEPEVTVVEKPLAVSLEELYNGTTKKLKIKRKTYDQGTGKQSTQDRILEVPIKKGLKAGSKIKFSDVGDQVEGGTQDLHFIVSEVSLSSPEFPGEADTNDATETPRNVHPRGRRRQAHHRNRSQRSPYRLAPNRTNH